MLLDIRRFRSRYTFVFLFSAHGNSKTEFRLPSHPFPATCHGNQWTSQLYSVNSTMKCPKYFCSPIFGGFFLGLDPALAAGHQRQRQNWTQISYVFPRNKCNFLVTKDGLEMELRNVGFSHRITDSMAAESWQDSKTSPTSRIAFNNWSIEFK